MAGDPCEKCGAKGGPKETLLSEHTAMQQLGGGRSRRFLRRLVARSYRVTNCCQSCRPPLLARP